MSWGNPAASQPTPEPAPVFHICEAPECKNQALLIIEAKGEQHKSCGACAIFGGDDYGVLIVGFVEGAPFDETARDILLKAWDDAKNVLERAKATEMDIRKAVFGYCFPQPKEGVNRIPLANGFALKASHKVNTNIIASNDEVDKAEDAAAQLGNEGTFLFERIITWEAKFSKAEFKKLDPSSVVHIGVKKLIEALIEDKPGSPTLEIEAPKAKLNG